MMNDEEMTLLSDSENTTDSTPPETAKGVTTAKRRKNTENKLALLLEQRDKNTAAQNEHKAKAAKLANQGAKIDRQIRDIYIRQFETVCKNKGFDYEDIIPLLENISDKAALEKVINFAKRNQ